MHQAGARWTGNWSWSSSGKVRPDRQIAVGLTVNRGVRRLAPGRQLMARLLPLCVGLLSLAGLATSARAGSMYRFEDDQGVIHYTNVPGDPRYSFVRKDPDSAGPKPSQDGATGPSQGL